MKMTEYTNLYISDYIRALEKINQILLVGISLFVIKSLKRK